MTIIFNYFEGVRSSPCKDGYVSCITTYAYIQEEKKLKVRFALFYRRVDNCSLPRGDHSSFLFKSCNL